MFSSSSQEGKLFIPVLGIKLQAKYFRHPVTGLLVGTSKAKVMQNLSPPLEGKWDDQCTFLYSDKFHCTCSPNTWTHRNIPSTQLVLSIPTQ